MSADPVAAVPGDPAGVAADARLLAGRARRMADVGEALRRMDTGAWTGTAADAWHGQHDSDVARWLQAADSLDAAAQALQAHADTLSWAQREAARAATLDPDAGRDVLERARAQLRETGDRVAAALRGEAALAPQDSLKQSDAEFYGGIWQSVYNAGAGVWQVLSDPAGAIAGVVVAAAHPVDTAKEAIAYDDWTQGREPRALGRNTGDLLLGVATLGAGKIASGLGRAGHHPHAKPDEPHGRDTPDVPAGHSPDVRAGLVEDSVLGTDGRPHGAEDSSRVYMVSEADLGSVLKDLRARLGNADIERELPKGSVQTWLIDPESGTNVTYRTFSKSGGATIDINLGADFPVKRFHVKEDG